MVAFNKKAKVDGKVLEDADGDAIPSEAFENDGSERQRKAAKRAGKKENLKDFVKKIDERNGDL